ncbi:MAG: hypothetical protein U1D30_08205 [Planctomycetota bacterium]
MTTTTFVCRAILLAMALFVVYPYTIYPLCLWILCRFRRHP